MNLVAFLIVLMTVSCNSSFRVESSVGSGEGCGQSQGGCENPGDGSGSGPVEGGEDPQSSGGKGIEKDPADSAAPKPSDPVTPSPAGSPAPDNPSLQPEVPGSVAPTLSVGSVSDLAGWSGAGTSESPFRFSIDEGSVSGKIVFSVTRGAVSVSPSLTCQSAPSWMTLSSADKEISFAPLDADVGPGHIFSCKTTGDGPDSNSLYFDASVININNPPLLTYNSQANLSNWGGAGSSVSPFLFTVPENTSNGWIDFTAADPDTGDTLALNCLGAPAWVSVDSASRRITFAPLDAHVGAGQNFSCKLSDGISDSGEIFFSSTVANVNISPALAYNSRANLSSWSGSGTLASPYLFSVNRDSSNGVVAFTATDSDAGDTLTLVCPDKPAWVAVNNLAKQIEFAPGISQVGAGQAFSCKVNDGTDDSSLVYFSATVLDFNSAPTLEYLSRSGVANWAGAGTSANPFTFAIEQGASGEIAFTAADVNTGDSLTLSCASRPSWVTIDNGAKKLTLAPQAGDVGSGIAFNCRVYDGALYSGRVYFSAAVNEVFAPLRLLAAYDIDGNSVDNSGAINGSSNATWTGQSGTPAVTLSGFNFNTVNSGWKGDGTIPDPYRLHFDGSNDAVSIGSMAPRSISVWFNTEDVINGSKYLLYSSSTSFMFQDGLLHVRYNGKTKAVGVATNTWYQVAVSNDGSVATYYLNGVAFASAAVAPAASQAYTLGSGSGMFFFDGSVGELRAYNGALTHVEVADLYLEGRKRFEPDPGVLKVSRVVNGVSNVAGGSTATILGWGLSDLTAVKFGGVAGSGVSALLASKMYSVQVPAGVHGYQDVVVENATQTDQAASAFNFTKTATSGLIAYLDAANIDSVGGRGAAETNRVWTSLVGGPSGGLNNFNWTSISGWRGSGTPADPYRLQFDGSNDYAGLGSMAPRTISLWFNTNTTINGGDYILYSSVTNILAQNGVIHLRYNGQSLSMGAAYNTWYHVVMTNDGALTKYYVNGVLLGETASGPMAEANFTIGAEDNMFFFDGAIGEFKAYSGELGGQEVVELYLEGRTRYEASPGPLKMSRIINGFSPAAGGGVLQMLGWDFAGVFDVRVGGASGSNVQVLSESGNLTVEIPAGTLGYRDVSIERTGLSETIASAFYYTDTPVNNLLTFLDAGNIDSVGGRGAAMTSRLWVSLAGGLSGGANNFNHNAQSGWRGDGTVADPYRLQFDGSNDYVSLGRMAPRAIALWFNTDIVTGGGTDYILQSGTTSAYVQDGRVYARYNNQAVSANISVNTWYHLVMSNSGGTTTFYLNGVEIGTTSSAAMALQDFTIGADEGTMFFFDGAIAELRAYSAALSPSAVSALYSETSALFP